MTVCPLTTDPTDAPFMRVPIEPGDENGLFIESRLMVDKITTLPKTRLGRRIGRLSDTDLRQLNQAVLVFLGLAGYSRG